MNYNKDCSIQKLVELVGGLDEGVAGALRLGILLPELGEDHVDCGNDAILALHEHPVLR